MAKKESNKLKQMWNDKNQRGKIYYAIFFVVLAILFVVNNLNKEEGEGPLPPDYWAVKNGLKYEAPDFNLKTTDGKEISLSDFRGKVVLLEFWSTWCKSCQKMTPELVEIQKKFSKYDFEIISVSMDLLTNHQADVVQKYIDKHGINYIVAHCDLKTSAAYGNIEDLPQIFMIKKDGTVYNKYEGWAPKSLLERDITLLLQ